MLLYEKARNVDLSCYDDPDFYNEQVLAISEVDKQIEKVLEFVRNVLIHWHRGGTAGGQHRVVGPIPDHGELDWGAGQGSAFTLPLVLAE